jgi:hypothetical protein
MTDPYVLPDEPVRRSTFVTVLAWLGIAGFSLTALMFATEALVIWPMIKHGVTDQLASNPAASANPQAVQMGAAMTPYLLAGLIALALLGIAASVGLLRRRNWGRILIIMFLALGVVCAVFGLLGGLVMGSMPASGQPEGVSSAQMDQIMGGVRILMLGGSVVVALLCSWLMYKLLSKPIQTEFSPYTP